MGFTKKDESFVCVNCLKKVEKLKYTSRDHCKHCLYSLHVDIEPGDRLNKCRGILVPINVVSSSKKGKVIEYKCSKCKEIVRNIAAEDDSLDVMYRIMEEYSKSNF